MSFMNKVVIITGAGSGVGAATALHFAKLDARLCLIDINVDNLVRVSGDCEKLGKSKVLKVVADLTKDDDVRRSIDSALKEYGKIDVLVNCAGIVIAGSVKDSDILAKYDTIMAVNLRAMIALTSLATPALIETKGCIVNMCSVATHYITKDNLPYILSKAGVDRFTKCVALELASEGVRVNCISPGPTKTNLLVHKGIQETEQDIFWETAKECTPLKRLVKTEEIAELVAFLASDKAKSVTGSNFVVDSGLILVGSGDAAELPQD